MNRDIYNRRRRRVDEYASTMSTHPQWEKRGFPELQNAYAQKCGRILYAVGNIYPKFPIHLIFLLGGGTR